MPGRSPSPAGGRTAGAGAGAASSVHSIGASGLTSACFKSSSTVDTGTIVRPFFTLSGISARSFSFSFGMSTVVRPPRSAASSFSLRPPIGSTRPRKVISPVIAMSLRTGMPVSTETIEVTIATPADGPSFGVAPSGTWTWMSLLSQSVGGDRPFGLLEAVRLHLLRKQVAARDLDLLILGVAGETDDLHAVHQR